MTTNTMVALKTYTVTGSAASSITISGIPTTYTDLMVVLNPIMTGGGNTLYMQMGNGTVDTGSNYSATILNGNGSSAGSSRGSNLTAGIDLGGWFSGLTTSPVTIIAEIMNYSNTTTYKTVLSRYSDAAGSVEASASLWRNSSSAINILTFASNGAANFGVGSTITVYGIANSDIGAYATGGIITQDSTYYYHAFGSSGTFTPSRALTADILVVAGGGGGGGGLGGGGGAGGVLAFASQSLSNGTGYTCTVGSGGAAGSGSYPSATAGSSGTNSQFASLTASVGGGGGGNSSFNALNGGAGGGGGLSNSAGTGSQGKNGGTASSSANYGEGGGGGFGTAGGNGTTTVGGVGGDGVNTVTNWGALAALVQATGYGYNGYIAGGGGGGIYSSGLGGAGGLGGGGTGSLTTGTAGVPNTGSGGGGGGNNTGTGGIGGSGLIVIRYAK